MIRANSLPGTDTRVTELTKAFAQRGSFAMHEVHGRLACISLAKDLCLHAAWCTQVSQLSGCASTHVSASPPVGAFAMDCSTGFLAKAASALA